VLWPSCPLTRAKLHSARPKGTLSNLYLPFSFLNRKFCSIPEELTGAIRNANLAMPLDVRSLNEMSIVLMNIHSNN